MLNNRWVFNFPHGATPVMEKIVGFHEKCILVIIFVLRVVLFLLVFKIFKKKRRTLKLEKTSFEIAWTIIPSLMILGLMVPSLEVLYFSEETGGVFLFKKIKVIGHQWYWRYEEDKSADSSRNFDSYLINDLDLNFGEFRNCEVDHPIVLEANKASRLLITSADVIHSWAIPEFGVKVDAIPGRLNQLVVYTQEVGRFFGFCSELCGVNHSFMPIVVEVILYSSKRRI